MNDPLTVPAREGIEAQNGLNDIFPGDPYPVRDQLKRGLDALRAQASGRGRISSLEIFALTDPLMDILSRCETQPATRPAPSQDAAVETLVEIVREHLEIDGDGEGAFIRFDSIENAVRAALAATRPAEAQAVAEGWKLVPVDPTMTMLNAAIDTDPHKLGDISPLGFRMSPQSMFERAWRSMLAASPATGGA